MKRVAPRQPELLQDVVLHQRRRRRRQRDHRRRPQQRQALPQHPVVGPEVVPPLRDAVRLVHGDRAPACAWPASPGTRHPQPLGRDEEEVEPPLQVVRAHLPRRRPVAPGVDALRREAQRLELGDLILHQRDQRAHHQRRPPAREAGELVAEGFTRAGGHDQQHVGARCGGAAHRLLITAERGEAEDGFEEAGQVGRHHLLASRLSTIYRTATVRERGPQPGTEASGWPVAPAPCRSRF